MKHSPRTRIIALGIAILVIILGTNTALLSSRQPAGAPVTLPVLDAAQIARHLAGAIQIATVPDAPAETFARLRAWLADTYPRVHANLELELVNDRTLLYRWPGDSRQAPILLLAHQDVVPADPQDWQAPPFAGEISDGYIWGRGTLDDKGAMVAMLEAIESLLAEGYRPARSVYLAFGHDEETGGHEGALKTAGLLAQRGLEFAFILDEGLPVTRGTIPGISAPVALVGIAEKGYLSLTLDAEGAGGHSSMPVRPGAAGRLAAALLQLEQTPFPARLTAPMREMLAFLAPEMPLQRRVVAANLWLFAPLVKWMMSHRPATDAQLRTTTAITMLQGGIKENVLPRQVRAVVNFRVLPGESTKGTIEQVRHVIDDPRVTVAVTGDARSEPSSISSTESAAFVDIARAIRQVYPEALVAPALVMGTTDSRHYAGLSPNTYRFSPFLFDPEDIQRLHGVNERVSVEGLHKAVVFYRQLLQTTTAAGG